MDQFTIASSAVLDLLWDDPAFRAHFHASGYELRDLARLLDAVFRPAYLRFRESVPENERDIIWRGVVEELVLELLENPAFMSAWRDWDSEYRQNFMAVQAEHPFGVRLAKLYTDAARAAYQQAFDAYRKANAAG